MPYVYEIDDSIPLATLRASGLVDQAERLAAFEQLRQDPRMTATMPILIDVRESPMGPAPGAGPNIATALMTMFAGHRIALLVGSTGNFGVARQIATLTHDQVAAFTDLAAALGWLARR
jgi:hypothetical protein